MSRAFRLTLVLAVALAGASKAAAAEDYFVLNAPATRPTTQPQGANEYLVDLVVPKDVEWAQPHVVVWDPNVAQRVIRPPMRTVKAPYLGVGVTTPDVILRAQLKLPDGAGLVVNFVDESGPSKEAVKVHDVLQKLDDQVLVNSDQLVTLVRMRKAGETVKLTVIREAKPVTVEVKLGEKDLPPLQSYLGSNSGDATVRQPAVGAQQAQAMEAYANTLRQARVGWQDWVRVNDNQANVVARGLTAGPVTFDDGEHVLQIRLEGGAGKLVVLDKKTGSKLFEGPIGTEEQWKAVPEEVRKKLREVSGSLNQFMSPGAGAYADFVTTYLYGAAGGGPATQPGGHK